MADRSNFRQADTELADLQAIQGAEVATFAGGCFWCLEAPFVHQPGVYGVLAGYMNGHRDWPTYQQVTTGVSGHREVVQVWFNPEEVTYQQLLDIYWLQIDPTDPGGQFADRGEEYRTAIFVHSSEQERLAEASKEQLELSGRFDLPIATEVLPAQDFYPAEDYHQHFYEQRPDYYQQYKAGSGRAGYLEQHPLKQPAPK